MFNETLQTRIHQKSLCVRPAEASELAEIADLRHNPKVAPFQYETGPDFVGDLTKMRNLQQEHPNLQYGLFSITLDDQFIGSMTFIRHLFSTVVAVGENMDGIPINAGWDLHPEFWGKGYMASALTIVFGRLFRENEQCLIRSECFAHNERCIKLMEKLGFQSVRMPWLTKLNIKLLRRCYHKHLRFHLTKTSFDNRPVRLVAGHDKT